MKTLLATVTPEYARVILANNNDNNRRISLHAVDLFAREMSEGRWGITHQGIAFYKDGTLADGQHRLAAVVKSGCNIEMMITHGIGRDAVMHVDTGRVRNVADVIKISGQANWLPSTIIPAIKLVYLIPQVSADEMVMLAQPIKESLLFVDKLMYLKTKGVTAALKAALILAHHNGASEPRLAEFAEMFYSGMVRSDNDTAVIKIRDYLILGDRRSTGGSKQIMDMNRSMVAIHKFLKYQPVKVLRSTVDFTYARLTPNGIINNKDAI